MLIPMSIAFPTLLDYFFYFFFPARVPNIFYFLSEKALFSFLEIVSYV